MTKVYSCLEIRKIYWYTVIIGISVKAGMRKSPGPLVRVAVMAILNSVISFISYKYTDLLTGCNYFSVGGLSEVRTENLAVTFIIVSVSFLICMVFSRETDALMPGGSIALSLGVDVKNMSMKPRTVKEYSTNNLQKKKYVIKSKSKLHSERKLL